MMAGLQSRSHFSITMLKRFAASILLYICDRAAMYLHHRYFTTVSRTSAIDTTDTSGKGRLVILKTKKPELFHKPLDSTFT